MDNHISAHRDGVVTALHVERGQVVDSSEAPATIEDAGGEQADPREARPTCRADHESRAGSDRTRMRATERLFPSTVVCSSISSSSSAITVGARWISS